MRDDDDDDEILVPDPDGKNLSFHLLKADCELYDEERGRVPETLISIKRMRQPKKKEDWVVLENGKIVWRLKDYRFSQEEKDFLKTAEGMQLLLAEYKIGTRSVTKIKEQIGEFRRSLSSKKSTKS